MIYKVSHNVSHGIDQLLRIKYTLFSTENVWCYGTVSIGSCRSLVFQHCHRSHHQKPHTVTLFPLLMYLYMIGLSIVWSINIRTDCDTSNPTSLNAVSSSSCCIFSMFLSWGLLLWTSQKHEYCISLVVEDVDVN